VVLPLVNNWPDHGGMREYVAWFLGLPDDSCGAAVNHDRSYTDPASGRRTGPERSTTATLHGPAVQRRPGEHTFELANDDQGGAHDLADGSRPPALAGG
jgi:hypothetical protein